MKDKRLLYASLIATLVLSMVMVNAGAYVPPSTPPYAWMYMEPDPKTIFTTADVTGEKFNVSVYIHNVTDMLGYEFKLGFNTTLLNATAVTPGPAQPTSPVYIPQQDINGKIWVPLQNVSQGFVWTGAFSIMGPAFTGSGKLFDITFEIMMAPPRDYAPPANLSVSCDLDLYDLVLADSGANPISCGADDGFYQYIRPQIVVGAPTAVCSVTPPTVYVGDTVTFDGTSSTDGGAPPLAYAWDVNSDTTVDYTTATVVVSCPTAGTFNVTLTVTNNASLSDTAAPQYWTVKEKAGAIIDLYTSTNRWCGVDTDPDMVGKGDDMPCDALSPDVNVTFYAEVTYNGAPVNHVFVAFEILWEWQVDWYNQETPWVLKNSCVLFATAETNKDGIAQIAFRVPTSCQEGDYIGKWFAMAKCKVQEVPIEDTMRFDVGYLIMMYDIQVLRDFGGGNWQPDTLFIREDDCLGVKVNIKSISWITRFAKFIVVAYDECNVPLGQVIAGFDVEPGYYCEPAHGYLIITGLCIPQWAYVGMGRVEVSVFTELPHACGVPYSKGISAGIEITWIGA